MKKGNLILVQLCLLLTATIPFVYQNCGATFHSAELGSSAPISTPPADPENYFRTGGVDVQGAVPLQITGKVNFLIEEDFKSRPMYGQVLETDRGVFPLRVFDTKIPTGSNLSFDPLADFVANNEVFIVNGDQGAGLSFVSGFLKDGTLYAKRNQIQTVANKSVSLQAAANLTTNGARRMMLVLVNFNNGSLRLNKAQYENLMGGAGASVKTVFNKISNEQGTLETRVVGPVSLPYALEKCDGPNNRKENMYKWWNDAIEAADRAGAFQQLAFSEWHHVWIAFPHTDCDGLLGMATLYGKSGWIHEDEDDQEEVRETITHEMGHNLGLHHAMARQAMRINIRPNSESEVAIEYGDETATMGGAGFYATDPGHNVLHQNHLGVIPANGLREVSTSGDYDLVPFNASATTGGARALKVGSYFISLAPPSGTDIHPAWNNKVLVHKIESNQNVYGLLAPKTELIARLAPGEGASIPNATSPVFRLQSPAGALRRVTIEMQGSVRQPNDFNITVQRRVSESQLEPAPSIVAGKRFRYSITTVPSGTGVGLDRVEFIINDTPRGEARLVDSGVAQTASLEMDSYETTNSVKVTVRGIGTNGTVRQKEITLNNASPFSDVPLTHPRIVPMLIMFSQDIWKGCDAESGATGTRYCPDQSVTRGHMAKMIIRAMKVRGVLANANANSSTGYFQDVASTHRQFSWIQRMWELGITLGIQAKDLTATPPKQRLYGPDQPTNRGQMAVFLSRAWAAPLSSDKTDQGPEPLARAYSTTDYTECTFTDVPSTHMFFGAIESLCHEGVARGCDETPRTGQSASTFCPETTVSHWMMATFVARTFGWAE